MVTLKFFKLKMLFATLFFITPSKNSYSQNPEKNRRIEISNSPFAIKNKKTASAEEKVTITSEKSQENKPPKKRVAQTVKRQIKFSTPHASSSDSTRLFNTFVASGDTYFSAEDWANAQDAYWNAAALKPRDEYVTNQLLLIDKKLEEIDNHNEMTRTYDSLITIATSLFKEKLYDQSLRAYEQALFYNPDATSPREQIKYINELKAKAKKEAQIKFAAEEEIRFKNLVIAGNEAVTEKKYYEAFAAYKAALSIHILDEWCLARIKIVENQLDLSDPDWKKTLENENLSSNLSDQPKIYKSGNRSLNDKNVAVNFEIDAFFSGNFGAFVKKGVGAYIDELTDAGVSGICRVKFTVSKDGSVTNVEAMTLKGTKLAEIAIKVISSSPKWTPAQKNGSYVDSYWEYPLGFHIQDK